jgi:hypothetical protein
MILGEPVKCSFLTADCGWYITPDRVVGNTTNLTKIFEITYLWKGISFKRTMHVSYYGSTY